MGRAKKKANKLDVQRSIADIGRIQTTLKQSLAASERQLAQIQRVSEQVNAEIEKIKVSMVFTEILPLMRRLTAGSINKSEPQLLQVARQIVRYAETQPLGFNGFLAKLQGLSSFISGEAQESGVLRARVLPESKRRLKILYITGMFPSDKHGGGLRVRDIISKLTLRHDVDLYSVFNPEIDQHSFQTVCQKLKASRLCDQGTTFGAKDILQWFKRRGIKAGYYDVIQFEYPKSVSLIRHLRPFGKKLGFTFMESVTRHHLQNVSRLIEKNVNAATESTLKLVEALQTEGTALRQTDFTIAVTESDALFTQKTFGYLPKVIPTGLNENFFNFKRFSSSKRFPNPTRCKSVIFIGYFDHSPNVDGVLWYLRQVHPRLCRKHKDYHFYVVGAGARSWVDKLRHEYIHDKQLSVIGFVEEFRPLLAACKVSVAPLISGAGIRGKINQYSALGVPTVATELGACGTQYRNGESILISKSGHRFAEQVSLLLSKDQLRRKIALNAEAIAKKNYLWGNLVTEIESIYVGN